MMPGSAYHGDLWLGRKHVFTRVKRAAPMIPALSFNTILTGISRSTAQLNAMLRHALG